MAGLLVETKLYIPRLRRSLVARPRLSERLSRRAGARLTLISAPAGFGKTTLLAAWLAAAGAAKRSVAWLSVEASDSQYPRKGMVPSVVVAMAASRWQDVLRALVVTGRRS